MSGCARDSRMWGCARGSRMLGCARGSRMSVRVCEGFKDVRVCEGFKDVGGQGEGNDADHSTSQVLSSSSGLPWKVLFLASVTTFVLKIEN
jgi:hypothetical protein